jgi:hypothetical protein
MLVRALSARRRPLRNGKGGSGRNQHLQVGNSARLKSRSSFHPLGICLRKSEPEKILIHVGRMFCERFRGHADKSATLLLDVNYCDLEKEILLPATLSSCTAALVKFDVSPTARTENCFRAERSLHVSF